MSFFKGSLRPTHGNILIEEISESGSDSNVHQDKP